MCQLLPQEHYLKVSVAYVPSRLHLQYLTCRKWKNKDEKTKTKTKQQQKNPNQPTNQKKHKTLVMD